MIFESTMIAQTAVHEIKYSNCSTSCSAKTLKAANVMSIGIMSKDLKISKRILEL